MLTNTPLISIIALNWNATAVTCEFLRSVRETEIDESIEVIVVDNASNEDPTAPCEAALPGVRIVRNSSNLGFSGGNNAGIRAARGEYFFIVNNDTEFTPGLLTGLLEIFREHSDAGIACPKFQYYFSKGTIEYAGYNSVNMLTGRNSMIGSREKDQGQYDVAGVTHYAHGGAMLVPRKVVEEVGLMPEEFFLYYEELDWSEQMKKKGYRIYYQPRSLIYHKESMTTGKSSPLKTFYLTRNRLLFMRRNAPKPALLIFWAYFLGFTVPKNTAVFLFKGQKEHLFSFWKGIFWQVNPSITF
jgi:GT2 family glycosyltransferase